MGRVIKVLRRSNDALYSPLAEGEWQVEYRPGVACYGPMGSLLYAFKRTGLGAMDATFMLEALSLGREGDDASCYEVWECEAEVVELVPRRAIVLGEYDALLTLFWKTFEEASRGGEDQLSVLDRQPWVVREKSAVWCRWVKPVRRLEKHDLAELTREWVEQVNGRIDNTERTIR
jgi:hypothetical protein